MLLLAAALVSAAAGPPVQHAAVQATEGFYAALAAGKVDRAARLTVPERYPAERLQKMKDALRVDLAKAKEAHVGKAQAVVVTGEVPPREEGRGRKGRWGVTLRRDGDAWLIRDFDFLPDEAAVGRYLDTFRKGEPGAERVEVVK